MGPTLARIMSMLCCCAACAVWFVVVVGYMFAEGALLCMELGLLAKAGKPSMDTGPGDGVGEVTCSCAGRRLPGESTLRADSRIGLRTLGRARARGERTTTVAAREERVARAGGCPASAADGLAPPPPDLRPCAACTMASRAGEMNSGEVGGESLEEVVDRGESTRAGEAGAGRGVEGIECTPSDPETMPGGAGGGASSRCRVPSTGEVVSSFREMAAGAGGRSEEEEEEEGERTIDEEGGGERGGCSPLPRMSTDDGDGECAGEEEDASNDMTCVCMCACVYMVVDDRCGRGRCWTDDTWRSDQAGQTR